MYKCQSWVAIEYQATIAKEVQILCLKLLDPQTLLPGEEKLQPKQWAEQDRKTTNNVPNSGGATSKTMYESRSLENMWVMRWGSVSTEWQVSALWSRNQMMTWFHLHWTPGSPLQCPPLSGNCERQGSTRTPSWPREQLLTRWDERGRDRGEGIGRQEAPWQSKPIAA